MQFRKAWFGLVLVVALSGCGGSGDSSSGGGASVVVRDGGTGIRPRHPGVELVVERRPYAVTGDTVSQLRRSLQQNGPGAYFGRVHSSISYSYKTQGNCRISAVSLRMATTMVLPDWSTPASASTTTRARWNAFRNALEQHERNHIRIDLAETEQLARMLSNLPAQSDCATLDNRVKQMHAEALQRATDRNRDYDARTDHGRTEGATL